MKKTGQIIFGIVISAFFLWLAFRKANLGQVMVILRQVNVSLLVLALAVSTLALAVRSYRWKLLGKSYQGVPWHCFFRATTIGLMLNVFLPFRSGDIFQSYVLARKSSLPQSYTLATVFMERLVDLIPPALMLLIGSFFIALPSQIRLSRIVIIAITAAFVIYVFIRYHEILIDYLSRFLQSSHSEKARKLMQNIANAIVFLKDKQVLSRAFPLTFCVWLLYTFSTFLVLRSLNIEVTFWSAFVIQAVSVLSVAIPSSPGFIGTWEFFCLLALSIFNVDHNRALSYAVLSHFMAFLPTTAIGLTYLLFEFVSGGKVLKDRPADLPMP